MVRPNRACMNAERERLERRRLKTERWGRWGPYLSERQWGTVREDYSAGRHRLGVFPARPCPLARVSLGRRRHCRHLRRPPAPLFRARAVERPGSDSQRAAVRADQQRRQSRRGRQGILLLSRRPADARVHEDALQVSAARSFRTRGSSKRIAAATKRGSRIRADRHRHVR